MAVDREIAGRCKCPICGALSQDVRVNVNQKLYGYCDNGCSFKFNSAQSRAFLPELRAGRNVTTQTGLVIFTTKDKENAENKEHGENIRRAITGNATRADSSSAATVGRIETRRREHDTAAIADGQPTRRSLFASWLTDDDDE